MRGKICFVAFFLFLIIFVNPSFAITTSFRSANTVTTDGTVPYANLNNCSVTDGQTCDRALGASYANLYFRDFGNYTDFGIPVSSIITKVRIRVTGKTSWAYYVGLSLQVPATSNCQSPSDLLTGYLGNSAINVQNFTVDVTRSGIHAVNSSCLQSYNFESNRIAFRINYSSSPAWSANIDNFEIAFAYEPGATPTPTPTPTPSLTPTPTSFPKIPLLLIPGIGGSELKTAETVNWIKDLSLGETWSHIYPEGEKVWVNNIEAAKIGSDDYFDILKMFEDGKTSRANLALTNNLFDGYRETISFFTSNDYTLNKDFFVFPYDWRRDISETKDLLDQKINQIKTQTGSQKVDIVAHSMGGLVARNYIADPEKAKNVRKLFTLGTPHLGAVDSLKNLIYGGCLTIFEQLKKPICIGVSPSEVKDVIQNMISGYELAPSREYFNFYSGENKNHPYPYKTELGALDYSQIKNYLTGLNYNINLFIPSEDFHVLDGSLANTNGVDVVVIAGSGRLTLGQIIEEKRISLLGLPYIHKDIENINGDETVPLFSASLIDSSNNKSLLGDAKVFYTNQKHGKLTEDGSALNLVKNILEGNTELPNGVSANPYAINKVWLFSSHSPVNMHIYDKDNNHTGPTSDGDFEENIPESSHSILDDAKFISIPSDGIYVIKFEATDKGSFDFKIRKYENDNVSREILYGNIPLNTVLTKAETQFDTASNTSPIIHLDENGDGTLDRDFNPFANETPVSTPTLTPTSTLLAPTSASTSSSANPAVSTVSAPAVSPTASSASPITQREPTALAKNDVLGIQTNLKNEKNTEPKPLAGNKKGNLPLIGLITIVTGVMTLIYIKLKK